MVSQAVERSNQRIESVWEFNRAVSRRFTPSIDRGTEPNAVAKGCRRTKHKTSYSMLY